MPDRTPTNLTPEVHYAEQLVLASALRWAAATGPELEAAGEELSADVALLHTAYHRQQIAGLGQTGPVVGQLVALDRGSRHEPRW